MNTNEITANTTEKANVTEKATDKYFIFEIRKIVKNGSTTHSENYKEVCNFLSGEKGALKWLLNIKENHDDRINVTREFGFNASDMLGDIIAKRTAALAAVAYDVNLADVLEELENVAWCCGIFGVK